MANCGVISGLGCADCEDVQLVGGIKAKNIYVGSLSQITDAGFTKDAGGVAISFSMMPYYYLAKFCAMKQTASALQELARGENNIATFTQTITGRFQQQSQESKNVWDDLKKADDLFVIVEKMDGTFELYGESLGLQITALTKNTGTLSGDDNTYTVTLSNPNGGEILLAPDFLVTDYQTTKTFLESKLQ